MVPQAVVSHVTRIFCNSQGLGGTIGPTFVG